MDCKSESARWNFTKNCKSESVWAKHKPAKGKNTISRFFQRKGGNDRRPASLENGGWPKAVVLQNCEKHSTAFINAKLVLVKKKHSWAWSKRGQFLGWWWAQSLKLAKPVLTKCINTEWEYKILVKNLWWKSLKRDIAMVGSLWPF